MRKGSKEWNEGAKEGKMAARKGGQEREGEGRYTYSTSMSKVCDLRKHAGKKVSW